MLLRSIVAPLATSVDKLVARSVTGRPASARRRSAAESLGHDERVVALTKIAEIYRAAEPLAEVDRFFGSGDAAAPEVRGAGRFAVGGLEVSKRELSWPSEAPTFCDDPALRERYAATRENRVARAHLFSGGPGRPAVVLVHGYRGGHTDFERHVWPIRWLLSGGLDVALFVLPFHASRASSGTPPRFPSSDPRFTNEGFRQAIADLRGLIGWLMEQGAPAVGAMGMSLGGFTVSLLATVERRLAFAAPVIPLASFADVAREAGRLVGSAEEQARQHRLLEEAHRVVSPFARAPLVDPDAVVVVAGERDRITPKAHGERLARHFGAELVVFPGGHLLQIGRSDGFRAIGRMLRRRGLMR